MSAKDHSWRFAFYEGAQQACVYSCGWDGDLSIKDGAYRPGVLGAVLAERGVMTLEEFGPLL